MPAARPPLPAEPPAAIAPDEASFIKKTVAQFYGPGVVVRSYSPDPLHLKLHIETDRKAGMEQYDCAGVLLARLEREQIGLVVSQRGEKLRGEVKIAYRQGVVL